MKNRQYHARELLLLFPLATYQLILSLKFIYLFLSGKRRIVFVIRPKGLEIGRDKSSLLLKKLSIVVRY